MTFLAFLLYAALFAGATIVGLSLLWDVYRALRRHAINTDLRRKGLALKAAAPAKARDRSNLTGGSTEAA